MQVQSPAPDQEATLIPTPLSSTDAAMSPLPSRTSLSPTPPPGIGIDPVTYNVIDPLVSQAAQRIADAINDFKRLLFKRETWKRRGLDDGANAYANAHAYGTVELALQCQSQTFELTVKPDQHGEQYPITVQVNVKPHGATNSDSSTPLLPVPTPIPSTYEPTRRTSDAELESGLVSGKRKKPWEDHGSSNKRPRAEDNEDIMPLVTQKHIDQLLFHLRGDVLSDTTECVFYLKWLLRRFKEERHGKSKWEFREVEPWQTREPDVDRNGQALSISEIVRREAASKSDIIRREREAQTRQAREPDVDRNELVASVSDIVRHEAISVSDIVRREAELMSNQIKWVEECRRLAAEAHDKREETWRTSSASFHDQQRQDRESFQNRMLHESGMHTQALNQILNEIKAGKTQSSRPRYPPPTGPAQAPFPTQPAPTAPGTATRGRASSSVKQSNQ